MASDFLTTAMAQLGQITALIVVVAIVNRHLTTKHPHLAHVLWLVVLLKCLTPPLWSTSTGVFCWLRPEQRLEPESVDVEWEPRALGELLVFDADVTEASPMADSSLSQDDFAAIPLTAAEADAIVNDETNHATDWAVLLRNGWLLTVGFVLLAITLRWWRFWRRVHSAKQRDNPELEELVAALATQLGVKRVRLLVTESRIGPAVVGVFRRTILMPALVVDRLAGTSDVDPSSGQKTSREMFDQETSSGSRLVPILAHELLHVRRGDLWAGLLQTVAQAVWWFHPLVWWAGKAASREAEKCCDEEVLAELNCDPATYARSLLDVLELKNELTPVPVFPGVKPVDVTSKRLERIMTLGQGCRRRAPWWCWLTAMAVAAFTLPGAAFVVNAQDEQGNSFPSPEEPVDVEAPLAPRPPVPRERSFRAWQIADSDSDVRTVVYETGDFEFLLSGPEEERRGKFERFVHSRESAKDAQINWFNGSPIIKATNAGHRVVQQSLAVFQRSQATAKQFDEFLDSVTRRPQESVVIDLQLVTMNGETYSDVEDAVLDISDRDEENDEIPPIIPAEKWEAILESAKQASIGERAGEGVTSITNPRLAVSNGRVVHIESVTQHPSMIVRSEGSYRTHGGLLKAPDWIGWKALALPGIRDDGSFWLGMQFEVRSLIPTEGAPEDSDAANLPIRNHELGFEATLREGQVVVLPGLNVNQISTAGSGGGTFFVAQIRKWDPTPRDALQHPRPASGIGVNSNAEADVVPDSRSAAHIESREMRPGSAESEKADSTDSNDVLNAGRHLRVRRRIGALTIDVKQRGDGNTSPRLIVTASSSDGRAVLAGTAETFRIRIRPIGTSLTLSGTRLQVPAPEGSHRICAQELKITLDNIPADRVNSTVRLQANNAEVRMSDPQQGSRLYADHVDLLLDIRSLSIDNLQADGLHSLNTKTAATIQTGPVRLQGPVTAEQLVSDIEKEVAMQQWEQRLELTHVDFGELERGMRKQFPGSRVYVIPLQSRLIVRGQVQDAATEKAILKYVRSFAEKRSLYEDLITDPGANAQDRETSPKDDTPIINMLHVDGPRDPQQIESERNLLSPVVASYPVADLVVPIPKNVVIYPEQPRDRRMWKAVSGLAGVVQAGAAQTNGNASLEFEQLVSLIESTIEPDSWEANGGPARIHVSKPSLSLVIQQTQQAHEEISNLLAQLRRLQDIQVSLQFQVLDVPESLLNEWADNLKFKNLKASGAERYTLLTMQQTQQLRKPVAARMFPKVTLFNGQRCHWALETVGDSQPRLSLQPVVSADRRFVHLSVRLDDFPTVPGGNRPIDGIAAIPNGGGVLLELPDLVNSDNARRQLAVTSVAGQPKPLQPSTSPRRFVLIQPEIVIIEQEEELLGLPAGNAGQ